MKFILEFFRFYAFQALALWAQGMLGHIGIAKEVTWGTPVAATDYFEFLSESITETRDRFPTRNAFAGFYEPDDYAGLVRIGGDLAMFGQPVSIGHLLRAVFNTMSTTVILSGFLWRNNFSTVKSEFADGVPSQPYTMEVHRNVTSGFQYAGAVCNRLGISMMPNQDVRFTSNWLAKAAALIARVAPTFPASSTDPFTFETASISIAGAATARLEAFTMSINNNLNGIAALNASNTIARIRRGGPQEARISGTFDFIDVAEYLDFKNQTERALQINITRGQSFAMFVDAPRFVYTTFPVNVGGRDRLTVGFDGMARYNASSGLAVDIGLTTIKSNY